MVAGGRIVAAAKRIAAPGEWRTNVALGASVVPAEPPPVASELALAAAKVSGLDLVGVDLLPTGPGGFTVIELNGAVDFRPVYALGEGDVFAPPWPRWRAARPSRRPPLRRSPENGSFQPIRGAMERAENIWRPLGELLVEKNLLTADELELALTEQADTGRLLGAILVERGYVSGPALAVALAEQYGVELDTERGFGTGLWAEIDRRHRAGRGNEEPEDNVVKLEAVPAAVSRSSPTPSPIPSSSASRPRTGACRTRSSACAASSPS